MVQGSGSATVGIVLVFLLLLQTEVSEATTYTVGYSDTNGWTYNVAKWPKGKSFKAGDVLGKEIMFFIYNHVYRTIYTYEYILIVDIYQNHYIGD